jgi:drug/metabolite transporter (DMT)-like permease
MALAEQGLSAVLLQRRAPPAEPAAGAPWLRRPTCQQPRAVRFVRRRRVMPNAGPLDRSAPQAMTSTTLARAAPDRVGWLALIGGTTIIAWSGVLARFLDVGPLAGAAWRMGLAVPALAAFSKLIAARDAKPVSPARFAIPLILAGLAFAADVGSFHVALTGTKVANAAFIGNVAPILTVVGGALFFAERPSARVWPALALALVGSWIMAGMKAPTNVGFGDAFALSAAVSYATYLMIIKRVRSGLDGASATLWPAAVSAIALTIAALMHGETMVPSTTLGWTIVVLLGVVSHAMGQGLTSVAVGRVPVSLVALVILAQPPFSALFAWATLGETMTGQQILGGAVILAAVLLARPR